MTTITVTRYGASHWGWVVRNDVGGSSGSHERTLASAISEARRCVPNDGAQPTEIRIERPREYGGSGRVSYRLIPR